MRTIVLGLEGIDPSCFSEGGPLELLASIREDGLSGALHGIGTRDSRSLWRTVVSGIDEEGGSEPWGTPPAGVGVRQASSAPSPLIWDALRGGHSARGVVLVDVPVTPEGSDSVLGVETGGECSDPISRTAARFESFRRLIGEGDWAYAQVVEREAVNLEKRGDSPDRGAWLACLGRELEATFASLARYRDEPRLVVIVAVGPEPVGSPEGEPGPRAGAFVMVTSSGVLGGEAAGARLVDLAPTILALAGRPIPDGMSGHPIAIERAAGDGLDDDEAVAQRLRGLGYLA